MIEAAEQCEGLSIPALETPEKLSALLANWGERPLIFCDESRSAPEIVSALTKLPRGTPVSVLIGPEGGFSPEEAEQLRALNAVIPISLGPRILRADTAAVAAITAIQSALGDWGDNH
jgi:16S rRNA (uracil1498-N3)-methyltransferase